MTSIEQQSPRDPDVTRPQLSQEFSTEQLLDRYRRRRSRSLRDEVIERHHHDVVAIAKALAVKLPKQVEIDDLVHAGICGLMHSIERFRADRGVPFRAFMRRRVRGAMLDELRNLDMMPRLLRRQQREWDDVTLWMRQYLRREPTELELQQAIELHRRLGLRESELGTAVEQELRQVLSSGRSGGTNGVVSDLETQRPLVAPSDREPALEPDAILDGRFGLGPFSPESRVSGVDSASLDSAGVDEPDADASDAGSSDLERLAQLLAGEDAASTAKPRFDSEWLDSVADETDGPAESMDRRDLIEAIRGSLKPIEWTVLEMHYLRGLSGKEIAERLDLSASRICQIHVRVLERLKQRLRDRSRS